MKSSIIGKVLDNYRIVQNIGRGGMGFVFKALNIKLNKIVALKMIAPALAMNENFMKRFEAEAKTLAKLENPNIIRIYDLRADSDYCYIVMEYVDGITLGRLIKEKGAIPWPHALKIFKQMLNAINHAHRENVIHRDIKPNNVLITRQGVVKITDFGLAKNQAEFGITQSATTGGTLFYMSPEQVKGLAYTDKRSDIYALGFTFYEMLSGQTPFNTDHTDFDIREAIIRKKFPPPHQLNKKIPARLSRIVEKAIEKKSEDRYQTIDELLQDLTEFEQRIIERKRKTEERQVSQDDLKVKKEPEPPIREELKPAQLMETEQTEPAKKQNRRRVLLAAAAFVILSVLVYLIGSMINQGTGVFNSKMGLLSVTSIPNRAHLFISGDSVGDTPLDQFPVAEGLISIQIMKDNFYSKDTTLNVMEDQLLKVHLELEPASIMSFIIEPDDAVLEIDGRKLYRENWSSVQLQVGEHQLLLTHPEYKDTTKVMFIAEQGINEPLKIALNESFKVAQSKTSGFMVNSDPPGASLYIDGTYFGKTPLELKNLSKTSFNLRLSKEGFNDLTEQIILSEAGSRNFQKTLKPQTGIIDIASIPAGAGIWLDDQELTDIKTPALLQEVALGIRKISIRKVGHANYDTKVSVAANSTISVRAELPLLKGALSVHAIPWGTIFVDEKMIKQDTNIKQTLELTAGDHKITVEHPSYGKYEKTVQIESNRQTSVEVNFNKTHKLKITALDAEGEPIWADILIDGQRTGDQTPKDLSLRTGTYTISVARNGYVMAEAPRKVIIDDSMSESLQFVLKKMNE